MIAVIEGKVIFYLVIALIGAVNLFLDKKKKQDAGNDRNTDNTFTTKPTGSVRDQSSEEERLRKFLETLGVPSTPQAPPRPVAPPLTRPAMQMPQNPPARPTTPPSSQIIYPPTHARAQKTVAPPVIQPPKRKPAPSLISAQEEEGPQRKSQGDAPAYGIVETNQEFKIVSAQPATLSSATETMAQVAARPMAVPTTTATGATAMSLHILTALHKPDDLRALVVLREVLGPPRSLQSI